MADIAKILNRAGAKGLVRGNLSGAAQPELGTDLCTAAGQSLGRDQCGGIAVFGALRQVPRAARGAHGGAMIAKGALGLRQGKPGRLIGGVAFDKHLCKIRRAGIVARCNQLK